MKKLILNYGLPYGLFSAAVTLLFQHGILGLGINSLLGIVVMIFVIISAGRKYKSSQNGYASFGDLVKLFMGIFILASFISLVVMFVNGQIISAETKEAIVQNTIETQTSLFEGFLPDDLVSEMEDQLEEQTSSMFDLTTLLTTFLSSIFGSLIIGLIAGAIMKKSPPKNEMLDGHL